MNVAKLKATTTVIGLCGLMGSGKDSFAQGMKDDRNSGRANDRVILVSFASHLKDVTALLYGWDRGLLEGDTDESRAFRETVDPMHGVTPRSALQMVGVQMRDIDPDFWVNALFRNLKAMEDRDDLIFVITDVRFPNEFRAIREQESGEIVRVYRGENPEWFDRAVAINMRNVYANSGKMNRAQLKSYNNETDLSIQGFTRDFPEVHLSEWASAGEDVDVEVENDFDLTDLQDFAAQYARDL